MKEYKLVKFYPSLPKDWKEGMIVGLGDWYYDYSPCSGNYRHKFIHKSEIENNPEYWQEVIKVKKVLFTTEDGVDVYEGDIYWLITGDLSYCGQKAIDKGRKFGHVFSTKEKAQEYIELNKPKYSYNQIYDFIKKQESTNNMWYTIFKNLEELKNDR